MNRAIALCAVAGLSSLALAVPPSFQVIGDLEGGDFYSEALGVSADGSIVVGTSETGSGLQAVYFIRSQGVLTPLGDLTGGTFSSSAYAISANGSVIVGDSTDSTGSRPVRWVDTGEGYSEPLVLPIANSGFFGSSATGISDDGTQISGYRDLPNPGFFEAFRFSVPSNSKTDLGDLVTPAYFSLALGISADGSTVVGSGAANNDDGNSAFRWRSGTGIVRLNDLVGGFNLSEANAASADGSVIVGYGFDAEGQKATRWVNGAASSLGEFAGGSVQGNAFDVSADGSVIVGRSSGPNGNEAFIWTQSDGMRNLKDVLTGLGLDLSEYRLTVANAISADGKTIAGNAFSLAFQDTQGFVVYLGDSGSTCPADFNGDGFVDDTDFVTFAAAYEAFTVPPADASADLTGDGFVDDSDFVIFAAAYEAFTCP